MARTVLSSVIGIMLLLYGLAAIVMGWWAYSVTHEAFVSVRAFTSLFEQQRNQAQAAIRSATGLLGLRDPAAPSGSSGPVGQGVQGLREGLRDLLGGLTGSAQATPTPRPSTGLGVLDDLENRLGQVGGAWTKLGEGPLPGGLLDRVEFAVNALLAWFTFHGVVAAGLGIYLLIPKGRRVQPNVGYAPPGPAAYPPQDPYQQPYWPPYGSQAPPPASPQLPASRRVEPPDRTLPR